MTSKKILLVIPSVIAARGLESILSDLGGFEVAGILRDLSQSSQTRLRSLKADVIVLDPSVFDHEGRTHLRSRLGELSDAAFVGFQSGLMSEEVLRQFDETISLYDEPSDVIRKLRSASAREQAPGKTDGQEEQLSAREKEVLVCVAKGMLNKEIADKLNLSIYTVITHRKNITRKTGIKTVAGLTVYALLGGLIDTSSLE